MPKRIVPLTDTIIRKTKPADKPFKLFDGGGHFLLVTPTGGKLWNLKYRFCGSPRNLPPYRAWPVYVFPSPRTDARPMSNNAVLAALRRMGYAREEISGHGFRSMASILLNEQGWNRDAIECQLAHAERNSVRASCNYAEYLQERRKMMQAWAIYLGNLVMKEENKIVPIRAMN